ncbi:MAG: hypothetical protein AAF493_04320 [Pseudomonadota bacterium]
MKKSLCATLALSVIATGIAAGLTTSAHARTAFEAGQVDLSDVAAQPPVFVVTDSKTTPGTACHAYGEDEAHADIRELKHLSYALTSGHDNFASVVCPLVRDNTANTNGLDSIEVKIYNPVAGVEFSCSIRSYDEFGGFIDDDFDATTQQGNQTLEMSLAASEVDGYYVMTCLMPPVGTYTSKIYSYTYREYARTDKDS